MNGAIPAVFAVLVVVGALTLLGWIVGGGAYVGASGRELVLRYPAKMRGLAVLCGVIAPVGIACAWFVGNEMGHRNPGRSVALLILAGMFLAIGVPLCLESFRKQVILSDDAVASRSWFGTINRIPWEQIESVTNHPISGYVRVCGAGVTVKVNHYLSGIDVFVAECKRQVEPRRYGNTFDEPIANPFA